MSFNMPASPGLHSWRMLGVGFSKAASLVAALLALILANTLFSDTGLEFGGWFGNIKL